MSVRYASVLAFLALAACDEVIEHDTEPRPDRPVLVEGAYEMVIEDVAAASCDIPRGELVGQRLGVMLRVEGDMAVLDMDGWVLRGEMAPGSIFVEGTSEVVVEVEDEEGEVDYDEPTEGGEAPPYDVDCEEGYDCGGEERPDERPPEGRPDEGPHGYASLDGRIFDAEHADGRLTIEMPGCEMALAVTLARGEIATEPPPEERPDERPPEDRPEERPEEGSESEEG